MPAKKKTETTEAKASQPEPEPESRIVMPGGIHAEDLETLNQPIDDRLAALLKDHQEMGSRPK